MTVHVYIVISRFYTIVRCVYKVGREQLRACQGLERTSQRATGKRFMETNTLRLQSNLFKKKKTNIAMIVSKQSLVICVSLLINTALKRVNLTANTETSKLPSHKQQLCLKIESINFLIV